jgi:hypothetical protein
VFINFLIINNIYEPIRVIYFNDVPVPIYDHHNLNIAFSSFPHLQYVHLVTKLLKEKKYIQKRIKK